MPDHDAKRLTLADLQALGRAGEKFAMLTAYDYPTAVAAQQAGIDSVLVGDSLGNVILGHETTRSVPFDLMLTLATAVRRGAPAVFLVVDLPYPVVAAGEEATLRAARQLHAQADCDAVKLEVLGDDFARVAAIHQAGVPVIAHLGLRPQAATSRAGLKAHGRTAEEVRQLTDAARAAEEAGAIMVLLEAVPPEAAQAVRAALSVPLVGCGAGPDCDAHVVVTHDLLGYTAQPPRFVPVLESLGARTMSAMRRWRELIATGEYPAAEHNYRMRDS